MNLSSRLLTGAALLVALPAAMAASTVDMTVTGSIVPAACTPTLSIADFNHGKISKADLNTDKPTIIPTGKWGTLSVSCTAPTVYAIRGTDNRADTVAHYNMYVGPYGLGLTPAGEKLGAHYLDVHPTKSLIDGKPTFVSVGDAAAPDGATLQALTGPFATTASCWASMTLQARSPNRWPSRMRPSVCFQRW